MTNSLLNATHFACDALEPRCLATTLRLPPISGGEVEQAREAFGDRLLGRGAPHTLVPQLLTRWLLEVSTALARGSACELRRFVGPRVTSACELLVLDACDRRRNRRAIDEAVDAYGLAAEDRWQLGAAALTVAIGSLSLIGRLPIGSGRGAREGQPPTPLLAAHGVGTTPLPSRSRDHRAARAVGELPGLTEPWPVGRRRWS